MKKAARKIRRSSDPKTFLFPIAVPVYALRRRRVNPLFRLAHYSLFSRMVRIKPN
jgi:hypothetical protein